MRNLETIDQALLSLTEVVNDSKKAIASSEKTIAAQGELISALQAKLESLTKQFDLLQTAASATAQATADKKK